MGFYTIALNVTRKSSIRSTLYKTYNSKYTMYIDLSFKCTKIWTGTVSRYLAYEIRVKLKSLRYRSLGSTAV